MDILTNQNNLEALKEKIQSAQEEIIICSAWIKTETLRKIFDSNWFQEREKQPRIRFILRMGSKNDFYITDLDALLSFTKRLNAEVRFTPNLHAKVNIIDNKIFTIGSFNLTGGGYGDDINPGNNEEIGMLVDDEEKAKELKNKIEDIWEKAFGITDDLLGFTLSDGSNRAVGYIGIKEIENGAFVEINSEDYDNNQRSWLGKVVLPLAHHTAFLGPINSESYDNERYKDYVYALTNTNPQSRIIKLKALLNESGYSHLRSGKIEILREIVKNNNEYKFKFNRVAIPSASVIKKADQELLKHLFNVKDSDAFLFMAANPDVAVDLDYEQILTKHIAVFGTTGSGKSFFVKRVVNRFFNWVKNQEGRVIVLDTHNEYSKNSPDLPPDLKDNIEYIEGDSLKNILLKKVIDEFSEFKELFGIKFSEDEIEKLKDAFKATVNYSNEEDKKKAFLETIKQYTTVDDSRSEIVDILKNLIEARVNNVNLPENLLDYYLCEELFKDLIDKENKMQGLTGARATENAQKMCNELLRALENADKEKFENYKNKLKEKLISSLLSSKSTTQPVFSLEKYKKIESILNNNSVGFKQDDIIEQLDKSKVYVINLAQLSDNDERRELVAKLLSAVFDKAKETKGNFKTLITIEEAHNYSPEGKDKGSASAYVIKKIASEGRKFNVGLVIVTQRPAYVSKDVLAQCNTSAIFRLINSNDIDAVSATIEAISENMLTNLPVFEKGQCILTGVGVEETVEVKVKE